MQGTFNAANKNGGYDEIDYFHRFSYDLGGERIEFVAHEGENKDLAYISQYRTGWAVSAIPRATGYAMYPKVIDDFVLRFGSKKCKQIFSEQLTLNPPQTEKKQMKIFANINAFGVGFNIEADGEKPEAVIEAVKKLLPHATDNGVTNPIRGLQMPAATTAAPAEDPAPEVKEEKPAAKAKADKPKAEKKAEAKPAADEAPELNFDKDILPLVTKISSEKGRDKAIALVSRFGVSKSRDLKPEQYPEFITLANRVIAGTYDPEDAVVDEEV